MAIGYQKQTANKEEKMSSETNKLVKDIEDLGYTVNKPKTQGILFNSKNEWKIKDCSVHVMVSIIILYNVQIQL